MKKVWTRVPYQKWPLKMPSALTLPLNVTKYPFIGVMASRGCCLNRARIVHAPCIFWGVVCSPNPQCPNQSYPGLSLGCLAYYNRSTRERVPATIFGPCPKRGRRISIRYKLGGQKVLYEYALEERREFAIATPSSSSHAETPEPSELLHNEALMAALAEPPKRGVDAESSQHPSTRRSTPT